MSRQRAPGSPPPGVEGGQSPVEGEVGGSEDGGRADEPRRRLEPGASGSLGGQGPRTGREIGVTSGHDVTGSSGELKEEGRKPEVALDGRLDTDPRGGPGEQGRWLSEDRVARRRPRPVITRTKRGRGRGRRRGPDAAAARGSPAARRGGPPRRPPPARGMPQPRDHGEPPRGGRARGPSVPRPQATGQRAQGGLVDSSGRAGGSGGSGGSSGSSGSSGSAGGCSGEVAGGAGGAAAGVPPSTAPGATISTSSSRCMLCPARSISMRVCVSSVRRRVRACASEGSSSRSAGGP